MKLLMLNNCPKFCNSTSVNIWLVANAEFVLTSLTSFAHITTEIPGDYYYVALLDFHRLLSPSEIKLLSWI
jgi:hypothetical protein